MTCRVPFLTRSVVAVSGQQSIATDHGPGLRKRADESGPNSEIGFDLRGIVVFAPFFQVFVELKHVLHLYALLLRMAVHWRPLISERVRTRSSQCAAG